MLPLNLRCIQPRRTLFNDISLNLTIFIACPNNKYIGDGTVGDPVFGSVEDILLGGGIVVGSCFHQGGVRPVVRLLHSCAR